ncbi:MAG: amidohydrolase family protein [Chloroflexi bacterium]|nr:amidohydrolase family protein [Chloroflexota bacterium]
MQGFCGIMHSQYGLQERGARLLIVHGTLITQDAERRVIPDGALRLVRERIVEVGASTDLLARFPEEERFDAGGMLVMPGFISAHMRPDRAFARGLMSGPAGAAAAWQALEAALGYEEIRYSTLLSCLNAIRSGTTTLFAYHTTPGVLEYSLDAVAEAVLQSGVRVCLSYGATERESATQARQGIEENARFARRARGEPLLAAAMGLDDVALLTPESLAAAVNAAALSGVGFHITVGGNLMEERERRIARNVGLVGLLKRIGVLGPRTLMAHPMDLTRAEMDTLREARVWMVAHPRASLDRPRSPEPLLFYREQGIRLVLGSGPYTNMLCEMAALHLLYGQASDGHSLLAVRRDGVGSGGLTRQEVLDIGITNNGAMASLIFGDRLGQLSPGALADIILVSYPGPTAVTAENLPWHLLALADNARVDTVIIHGRIVMRKGVLRTLDEERILSRSRELAAALWARL